MSNSTILLEMLAEGAVRTSVRLPGGETGEHQAAAEAIEALQAAAANLAGTYEQAGSPLADPVTLADLGRQMRDVLLGPLGETLEAATLTGVGTILICSPEAGLLNLPWELLPSPVSGFLVADGRWALRRTTRTESLPQAGLGQGALPLRILFSACAPVDEAALDFEREEEAMLKLANQMADRVHLSIAETGTFDELNRLISELKPHVVHLSGHGVLREGIGYFAFEDERGRGDLRDARSMAEQLFADRGVRAVFVSGCQSAQAGSVGVCQALTAAGHVPVALGWGASVADGQATEFARIFYHELAAGRALDAAVATARRELFAKAAVQVEDQTLLNATFALPMIYASDSTNDFLDETKPRDKVARPGVKHSLLGDGIIGLREGFVGRRRLLQRLRPGLRDSDFNVLLLTGMGGAGKSTLATRLANRCMEDGWRLVAVKATRSEEPPFALRLVEQIGIACQRMGRGNDYALLTDGNQPLPMRLRLAVEILNEAKILLVLDNLEDLMPPPPSPPRWTRAELADFFRELFSRLTGEGRCILTCRYVPEGFDSEQPNVAHEAMPDFSVADFIKCLSRKERVLQRMAAGEISKELLTLLHQKIGGTPRFIEQAAMVLATADLAQLEAQLNGAPGAENDAALEEARDAYLEAIFLPELYEGLTPGQRLALSRLALVELPVPLDGLTKISGFASDAEAETAAAAMLARGLLQRFGEEDEAPSFAVYPLLRGFLTAAERLPVNSAREANRAAAVYFQSCIENEGGEELTDMLFACREHAEAGGDVERLEWASAGIGWLLYRRSEFKVAVALVEPLVGERAGPRIIIVLADNLASLGEWSRAKHLYVRALELLQSVEDSSRLASTLHNLAQIEFREGNYKAARERFERALKINQDLGNRYGEAATLHSLASVDLNEGSYDQAQEKLERALSIRADGSDRAGEAATLHQLATLDLRLNRYPSARERFQRVLRMRQEIGDRAGEAGTWHQLGTLDLNEGSHADAREKFQRALLMRQAIGDRVGEAGTWHQLATIDLRECSFDLAREKFVRALGMRQSIGDLAGEAATLAQIGTVAWRNARQQIGVSLQAIAFMLFREIGDSRRNVALRNFAEMIGEMGLGKESAQEVLNDARRQYQEDRANALVTAAFEGL